MYLWEYASKMDRSDKDWTNNTHLWENEHTLQQLREVNFCVVNIEASYFPVDLTYLCTGSKLSYQYPNVMLVSAAHLPDD